MRQPSWLVPVLLLGFATPVHAGGLTFVELERDGVGGVDGIHSTTGVALSPNGAHLYVTGRSDNAVAVFSVDGGTGALSFVEQQRDGIGGVDGLAQASGVAVSSDGAHVYVSAELDDAVAVFSRNAGTGALTFVEAQMDGVAGVDGLRRATSVALSADGAHLYATGQDDDAVAVFSRNAGTGALTFVEVEKDGIGGVGGLRRPRAVAVSSDGASVYVAGEGSDAVAVFSRNAGTGALTFVEFQQDGVGDINGLRRPKGVTVSPDGATVYVAGEDDNALTVWDRDGGTGALTFVEMVKNGGEVKGISGASAVTVSPDGAYVYATGSISDAVAVFRRNATTGRLIFLERQANGTGSVDGLQGASAVTVSTDGLHVYAAGREQNSVVAFTVDSCGNGNLGPDEQCDDGNLFTGDGCSSTCRLELCGAAPAAGCRQSESGSSALKMTDKERNSSDSFDFKFHHGEMTLLAEFGNPTTIASYEVCFYDSSAAPQPILALAAPADGLCKGFPCWRPGSGRYQYKDALLTPDGFKTGLLREGLEDGRTDLRFKGKGSNLQLPPFLPLVSPYVVQVRNNQTGVCWEATFSNVIFVFTDTGAKLLAKSD